MKSLLKLQDQIELTHFQSKFLKVLILTVFSTLLFSCQNNRPFERNNDPLRDHPELKNYVPPAQAEDIPVQVIPEKQKFLSSLFDISIKNEKSNFSVYSFIEGHNKEYQLHFRSFVENLKYSLIANNLPPGMTLTLSGTEENTWILKWAPPLGTVPVKKNIWQEEIEIQVIIAEDSDPKTKSLFESEETKVSYLVQVSRDYLQPEIKVNFPKQEIKMNELVQFEVNVKDPSGSELPPDVFIGWDENSNTGEKTIYPISHAIYRETNGSNQVIKPAKLNDGSWKFKFVLSVSNIFHSGIQIPSDKNVFDGQFVVFANSKISETSGVSPTQIVKIKTSVKE